MKIDTKNLAWEFFEHKGKIYLVEDEDRTLYRTYNKELRDYVDFPKSECKLLKKIEKQVVLDEYSEGIAKLEDIIERYKTAIKELDSI